MTAVSVEAFAHGDGWLAVATQEWIDERGEYAEDLTDDLREWMDEQCYLRSEDAVLVEWIVDRTGERPAGLHGDGDLWHHNLVNFADHLIDDLGFVVLTAAGFGALMITVSDHTGMYVPPTVYRSTVMELEDWADYSDAMGECVNGHRWYSHDAAYMHGHGTDRSVYRLSERVHVPFGDDSRAYVACPDCGKAVRFDCHF